MDDDARDRAINRFDRIPPTMGSLPDLDPPPARIEFEWQNLPIPLSEERTAAKVLIRRGEFGWVEDERIEEIKQGIEGLQMTLEQALSLRSALLQEKVVYTHRRMQSRGKEMAGLYESGTSILELSKRFDFAPMNIFRQILVERRWSKAKIRDMLREPKRLPERDRAEFQSAEEADRVANVDQSETHVRADRFEDILASWFEGQGVRLRRQEDLVRDQQEEHGRPVRTPDLLFLDDIRINGQPIAWIDAKHFYGADVGFQRKKVIKQMNRYAEEWGQGAIVFRHGFCANLHIPCTVLLDRGPLDLSSMA